jgi:hypothetical protein
MNQEVTQEVQAEVSAPEQIETASTESVEASAPENTEAEQKAKTFTQEELDAAIGKRLAREQRKWERDQAQRQAETQVAKPAANLTVDQFETTEAYAEALAEQKAQELIAKREQQKQFSEVVEVYHEKEEEARNKYDDFEQVAYNPALRITDVMAQTIQSSDIGPDEAYFLGQNPKEADRISRLAPFLQAKEIGRIEAKLASEPPKPTKTSSAPAPIAPVNARTVSAPSYDTTDPRSAKTLSTSEWIAAENKRERERLAARNR